MSYLSSLIINIIKQQFSPIAVRLAFHSEDAVHLTGNDTKKGAVINDR